MGIRGAPFVDERFLNALQITGCTGPGTGWHRLSQFDAPAYLKDHSHGEFVFDWMWAQAAQGAGIPWYPKLLLAAPLSPVTGPRLGLRERSQAHAQHLLEQIQDFALEAGITNAGINFCDELDREVLRESAWLERIDWQFHWENLSYESFDDFLGKLKSKSRKNIKAERRKTHQQGWSFRWVGGDKASQSELHLAHQCYLLTHQLYGNHPALNRSFFEHIAPSMGPDFLLCIGTLDGKDLAVAIFFKDQHRLYGRYWGSLVETKDVHFEACYYQGIEYCIDNQLDWFEPGAQGEHKIKRGFLPVQTFSFHWIGESRLRQAIEQYLQRERNALLDYRQELEALNPYGR